MKSYLEQFTVIGHGGTDFRPQDLLLYLSEAFKALEFKMEAENEEL